MRNQEMVASEVGGIIGEYSIMGDKRKKFFQTSEQYLLLVHI